MTAESIPYGRQSIDEADVAVVVDVLRSHWLTTGPAVDQFEAALERAVGAPCVAVNSGTAALHAAYAAGGVGSGTTVVTSPMTFAATATAALHLGAKVVFADVSDDTLNLDPEAAAEAVTPDTRVVTAVDFAGHPAELDELRQVAHRAGALLVEDAAHSIGARYRGRSVGSIADLTTFSFHPVKTITTGEGGAVAGDDGSLLDAVRQFRSHGLVRDRSELRQPDEGGWHQEVQALGLNYRMPDVLAALGCSQLRKLRAFVDRRAVLVDRYRALLADIDGVRLPIQRDAVDPAWHLFVVRVLGGRRREVFERMRAAGVGVQVHYLPVYRHPLFVELGYPPGACPVAEAAYAELLSLPLFPALTESQQDRVAESLQAALS